MNNKSMKFKNLLKVITPLCILISSLGFAAKFSDKMISRDQALNIVKKHSNFSNKAIIETELDDGKYRNHYKRARAKNWNIE